MCSGVYGRFQLKMPDINWTQEITAIKQSMGVMIVMFSGFAYSILFCVFFLLLPGWKLGFAGYMGCCIAVDLILCGALYLWLRVCM